MKSSESRELRIGNLVIHEATTHEICEIGENHCKSVWKRIPNEIYVHSYYEIEPIPLSEEWLIKFGFEKRAQGVCDYFYIGRNHITHDWLFDLVWLKNLITDEYEYFPFYKNGRHEIQYVHQLQNLFFALTGKELTIKD